MSTISFWIKSLKVIPQVSKEEWDTLDIISKWLVASRSAVFIMTAISCGIGGILAYYYTGNFNILNFIICLIGLVLAHASNNLLNDLVDYKKGIDQGNYYRTLYGPQVIERLYISIRSYIYYILTTLVIALLCGVFLVYRSDINTLYLMIAGIIFLLFYTWPLKYIGLGEITVVFVWGPLMIGGAYYVTSNGSWNWDIILLSLVYAIGPTSVIFGKHIDKLDKDQEKKVYTLPVLIGEKAARYTTLIAWILQYVVIAFFIYKGILSIYLAIIFLALPKFVKTYKTFLKPKPTEKPDSGDHITWPLYFASYAFVYNRRFSILFLLGLLITVIFNRI